ncbi:hypothetical protein AAFN88_13890 [Pelagibius sp. CAU 1746]
MPRPSLVITLIVLTAFLAGCRPPAYQSAHPDSRNSGPFWEREEQRD